MLHRNARPFFPRELLGLAMTTGVVPPRNTDMPDAAQDRLFPAVLERGRFSAGTMETAGPFFCAPSWDATAACSIVRRCSNPLSCRTASTQAIPLPSGAALTA